MERREETDPPEELRMCGRYKVSTKAIDIVQTFSVYEAYEPPPRYNVAPTDPVPVIKAIDHRRVLVPMRWGLIPFWAKDARIGARHINARVESILEKPVFRDAFERRRCLVVADGFYEWAKADGGAKRPHLVAFDDGHVYAFAALWARWKGPEGPVESVAVLTGPPNEVVAPLHDRMPVIFDPTRDQQLIAAWLDVTAPIDLDALGSPRPLHGLVAFPVSDRVGNVKNDDASLAEPVRPV